MERNEPYMILFDTNIIINMVNNPQDSSWEIYFKEKACICGITITELYRGLKTEQEKNKIEEMLSGFEIIKIEQEDWKQAGLFIASLRENGLSVPFQDAIIAYMGIKTNSRILTYDKHFKLINACDERVKLVL